MSATQSDPVRVMLVGDCPLVRSGFSQVLSSAGIAVVASVATAVEAAGLLRSVPADVVVLGAVTRHAGAAETREIRSCHPATAVLVLGRSGDGVAVRAALAAGAQGTGARRRRRRRSHPSGPQRRGRRTLSQSRTGSAVGSGSRTPGARGRASAAHRARASGAHARGARPLQPRNRGDARAQRQHHCRSPCQPHEDARRAQDRRARALCRASRPGDRGLIAGRSEDRPLRP